MRGIALEIIFFKKQMGVEWRDTEFLVSIIHFISQ